MREVRRANVEIKIERAFLVVANRFLIQLAGDMTRHVVQPETDDAIVDSAGKRFDVLADLLIHLGDGEPFRRNGREIDELTRPTQVAALCRRGLEVPLDESLARVAADTLLVQLAP